MESQRTKVRGKKQHSPHRRCFRPIHCQDSKPVNTANTSVFKEKHHRKNARRCCSQILGHPNHTLQQPLSDDCVLPLWCVDVMVCTLCSHTFGKIAWSREKGRYNLRQHDAIAEAVPAGSDSKLWFTNKPEQRLQYPGMEHIGDSSCCCKQLVTTPGTAHPACEQSQSQILTIVSCNSIAVYQRNRNKTGGSAVDNRHARGGVGVEGRGETPGPWRGVA